MSKCLFIFDSWLECPKPDNGSGFCAEHDRLLDLSALERNADENFRKVVDDTRAELAEILISRAAIHRRIWLEQQKPAAKKGRKSRT